MYPHQLNPWAAQPAYPGGGAGGWPPAQLNPGPAPYLALPMGAGGLWPAPWGTPAHPPTPGYAAPRLATPPLPASAGPRPARAQRGHGRGPTFHDWVCATCAKVNFERRTHCLGCQRPQAEPALGPGQWRCPPCAHINDRGIEACRGCGQNPHEPVVPRAPSSQIWRCTGCSTNNMNYRAACFNCDRAKPVATPAASDCPQTETPDGPFALATRGTAADPIASQPPAVAPLKSSYVDWMCGPCRVSNFQFRQTCFRCKARKSDCQAQAPPTPSLLPAQSDAPLPGPASAPAEVEPPTRPPDPAPIPASAPRAHNKPQNWACPQCRASNYPRRQTCFRCRAPQPESEPPRPLSEHRPPSPNECPRGPEGRAPPTSSIPSLMSLPEIGQHRSQPNVDANAMGHLDRGRPPTLEGPMGIPDRGPPLNAERPLVPRANVVGAVGGEYESLVAQERQMDAMYENWANNFEKWKLDHMHHMEEDFIQRQFLNMNALREKILQKRDTLKRRRLELSGGATSAPDPSQEDQPAKRSRWSDHPNDVAGELRDIRQRGTDAASPSPWEENLGDVRSRGFATEYSAPAALRNPELALPSGQPLGSIPGIGDGELVGNESQIVVGGQTEESLSRELSEQDRANISRAVRSMGKRQHYGEDSTGSLLQNHQFSWTKSRDNQPINEPFPRDSAMPQNHSNGNNSWDRRDALHPDQIGDNHYGGEDNFREPTLDQSYERREGWDFERNAPMRHPQEFHDDRDQRSLHFQSQEVPRHREDFLDTGSNFGSRRPPHLADDPRSSLRIPDYPNRDGNLYDSHAATRDPFVQRAAYDNTQERDWQSRRGERLPYSRDERQVDDSLFARRPPHSGDHTLQYAERALPSNQARSSPARRAAVKDYAHNGAKQTKPPPPPHPKEPSPIPEPKGNIVSLEDLVDPPGRYIRPPQIVIIFRGLPGSGKSYVAKDIKAKEADLGSDPPRILGLDDYFECDGEYEYEADLEPNFRQSLIKSFKKQIDDGYFAFIMLDCINNKTSHYQEMWSYAKQRGFEVYIAEIESDPDLCATKNTHKRTRDEIEGLLRSWEPTPAHMNKVDMMTYLQDKEIDDVDMEIASVPTLGNSPKSACDEGEQEKEDDLDEDGINSSESPFQLSKWELSEKDEKMAQLDGISSRSRRTGANRNTDSIEDWLELDQLRKGSDKQESQGKKRVRWADIEEQREQMRMREVGFVVGKTNWNRMMNPGQGSSALTRTKIIPNRFDV